MIGNTHPNPTTLAVLRQRAGLTYRALAERTGHDPYHLNAVHRDRRRGGPAVTASLARVYGITPDELRRLTPTQAAVMPLPDTQVEAA